MASISMPKQSQALNKGTARQPGLPAPHGLYHPHLEHDSCGVGFVAHMEGEPSHKIVQDGLAVLANLTHRGAVGSDPKTGDGAGILIQKPHSFLQRAAALAGFDLPEVAEYGVGLVFLPPNPDDQNFCMRTFERVTQEEGQQVIGWRDVPTDNSTIGLTAREVEPVVKQIFIRKGELPGTDPLAFERRLYVIRQRIDHKIKRSWLPQYRFFYIPSLSSRTLIYKGLLLAEQVPEYFPDLRENDLESSLALVHQRYSTNTFPTWDLAQPFRYLAHNGEINTLQANVGRMRARQSLLQSELLGPGMDRIFPITSASASDSANIDQVLEFLVLGGRSLPHAMMMLIPEPWDGHETMPDNRKAFYEYHSCLMEPWDGPASIAFTDGIKIGAVLDRNGLRPSRYTVTKDKFVVMASETGVLPIEPSNVALKGRLQPGRMFLIDTEQGRIVADEELKEDLVARRPYRSWLNQNRRTINDLPLPGEDEPSSQEVELVARQQAYGYTHEDINMFIKPMAIERKDPIGSMGNDAPLAVLSERSPLLYGYFKQLFAQVTNPPLDAIREELVTSLNITLGSEGNVLAETPEQCRMLQLTQPILTDQEMRQIKALDQPNLSAKVISILFKAREGRQGMQERLERIYSEATMAIEDGATILVLSDRGQDRYNMAIPSLLAVAGLNHHLIREGTGTRVGIVVETGEAREVHHCCLLLGYGASAINPYLVYETIGDLIDKGEIADLDYDQAVANYIYAVDHGILKVMSKMGISTLESYRGSQIFEAVGLSREFVDRYFTWTTTRLQGVGMAEIFHESAVRHRYAFPQRDVPVYRPIWSGGNYKWRRDGEYHQINPMVISLLQEATRSNDRAVWQQYTSLVDDPKNNQAVIRSLLEFNSPHQSIPLEEVEPVENILKRFKTGAMSYGSISREAHESLAIAMNRIGGKSNTGEGGEEASRFTPDENGDWRRSAIKQVASGRFGVTNYYLVNADEIQIKMAQGAKPGEGGQLPGHKVDKVIAKTRHSTPGVGLISPPPHHDIYSIEDLAQLIHDLKNANNRARISVKLVAEVGVGTIAAGVSKGHADVVLISGHDGGTGASPQTSIKNAGLPWELGLAETHQTLVLNDLRSRITVETDGQLKSARDVAIAILLGAEEFGFATAALVVLGCVMMRKCHNNTCPVGIATQDPRLRKNFRGDPAHVVNFFRFIAEDLREIMAQLGFRTVNEMVGHVECLQPRRSIEHWKARNLDFSALLAKPEVPDTVKTYCCVPQDHGLQKALDNQLIELAKPALEQAQPVQQEIAITNTNRTIGTMLSSEISRRYGEQGLPDGTIRFHMRGSAGQSFGAFSVKGLELVVEGDANDYFGKGCSGARLVVFPDRTSDLVPEQNIIIGNVAFYGATSGQAFVRGIAGERFCVRNSGIQAVVEGIGDHGCEYMTGGVAVILGPTGRNFGAGMSGGIAYVWNPEGGFAGRCNYEMIELEALEDEADKQQLRDLITAHQQRTGSTVAQNILDHWDQELPNFVKVMPVEYKRALAELERATAGAGSDQQEVAG